MSHEPAVEYERLVTALRTRLDTHAHTRARYAHECSHLSTVGRPTVPRSIDGRLNAAARETRAIDLNLLFPSGRCRFALPRVVRLSQLRAAYPCEAELAGRASLFDGVLEALAERERRHYSCLDCHFLTSLWVAPLTLRALLRVESTETHKRDLVA